SHEIRTPLTSIIGFSETLDNPDATDSERYVATRTIIRNSHHLQQMINDVLDISKIEAGELKANLENTSIFDILGDIESLFSANAKEKNLDFTVNYEYPIPLEVHTDPLRVRQVLINLCGNALKFTKNGGISIDCRYQKPNIVVSITDNGIGMNQDQIKKVFNLFTQADSTTTRQFGGTGLGLPLSRKIAHLLNGEVNVESIEGKGSRFEFHFYAGDQADNNMTNSKISVRKNPLNSSHQRRLTLCGKILVVDDARDNQILITSILKRAGLTSYCVDNGQLALDALKNESYDLIIMDKQMPVLDGISATKIIRKSGNNIPIIALTADAFEEDRQESIDAGCNAYVTKPINRNLLLTTIEKLLNKDDKLSRSA
ncbi:MAG: ATP-binding protein, partial [Gammaproteobacteria bacterium]|nr:ATP-binding protein [Gammaproteobacteria bacterium]